MYWRMDSRCFSESGPHGTASAIISSVTSEDACSKCLGVGSSWASSPGSCSLGQSRCAVLRAAASSSLQQTFVPAWTSLLPQPDSLRSESISAPYGSSRRRCDPRAAWTWGRNRRQDVRRLVGQGIDARLLHGEVLAVVAPGAALPQETHDLDGLLEHLQPHVGPRPAAPEYVLVQVLACPDAQREASIEHHLRGRLGQTPDHAPHQRAVALLVVPGVVVVRDPQRLEAGHLGHPGLLYQLERPPLLAGQKVAYLCHARTSFVGFEFTTVAPLSWYTPRRKNLLGEPLARFSFQHRLWRPGTFDPAALHHLVHLSCVKKVNRFTNPGRRVYLPVLSRPFRETGLAGATTRGDGPRMQSHGTQPPARQRKG